MKNHSKITTNFLFFSVISSLTLTACASIAPVAVTQNPSNIVVANKLASDIDVAPKLAAYTQFDLVSQSSGAAEEQKVSGVLSYKATAAYFEAHTNGNTSVDRLFVQPDACRDDASPDCQRRFVISGHLTAFNTSLNCYIQVRNDTSVGYSGQSIMGICQDRNRRSFAITLFPN
jgi:hypothetical protein